MNIPEWLTREVDGYIHVTGHRIGLEDVVYFYTQGDSPEMLHCRFPTVALATFHKIIAYYLENQAEVDAYCGRSAADVARQRTAAATGPSVDELRKRREAQRLAQGA